MIKPTPGIFLGIPNCSNGTKGLNILSAMPTTNQAAYSERAKGATINMPDKKKF
ncbi:MAG: hypothetical protein P8J53_04590 [Alphaproteobacteria bacterium]|nr:hypothetical protein [Alphaproteobacteria bacterium]